MKVSVRAMSAVLFLPLAILLVFGCSKKASKTPEADVSQSIMTTKPGGGERMGAGSDQSTQMAALRGEDVPISEATTLQFAEPSPGDKLALRSIYFDFDRSNIKPEFQPVLEGIAQWLNDNFDKQLLVEGHCDERGTNEYNLALGERRALSVRRYLVGLGISPDRLHTISYGEERPADPGTGEAAWAKNRRAEFKVSVN